MKREMFFPNSKSTEQIISLDMPPEYKEKKNIILQRDITDYVELENYLKEQNKMDSGIYTLLPSDEIKKYMKFSPLTVLMRSGNNKALIGSIMSIPFPIRCALSAGRIDKDIYTKDSIIMHGATTFLNVHSKLRGNGLCMALIRELTKIGYENKIYCSYSLTSFPLSETSIPIISWYRPINLISAIALGFSFPNWNEPSTFMRNRMNYNTKIPKNYNYKIVNENIINKAYDFYHDINKSKRFVFSPDIDLFSKWIKEYPTYIITNNSKIVGIISITTIHCKMETGLEGKLCCPILFNAFEEEASKVYKCCIALARERNYDVLYSHCIGDITSKILQENYAIETPRKSYFSLYNNGMKLSSSEIYVPIF